MIMMMKVICIIDAVRRNNREDHKLALVKVMSISTHSLVIKTEQNLNINISL